MFSHTTNPILTYRLALEIVASRRREVRSGR